MELHEQELHDNIMISINQKWCKRCGICLELCPQHVFESKELGRIEPARTEDCKVCRLCEVYCPEFAITVDILEE